LTSTNKDPILVVVQLTGGNDYINTVIPYQDSLYYDSRKTVSVAQEEVLPVSDELAFNPALTAVKDLYDQGKVAVINGIGYPGPNRSHFRSGTPANRKRSAPRAGWDVPSVTWTPTPRTC